MTRAGGIVGQQDGETVLCTVSRVPVCLKSNLVALRFELDGFTRYFVLAALEVPHLHDVLDATAEGEAAA